VLVLVIRQALVSAVVGVAGGLLLASWWSSSVEAVIVGISPRDPWSFTVAVTVASARPALRASRIDPALTLRAE
jgi:ABC-type lipoprotein release transport system permease subunit